MTLTPNPEKAENCAQFIVFRDESKVIKDQKRFRTAAQVDFDTTGIRQMYHQATVKNYTRFLIHRDNTRNRMNMAENYFA